MTRHHAFPDNVHVAADPPSHFAVHGRRTDRPTTCEVMCIAPAHAGTVGADEEEYPEQTPRCSKPPCEKPENRASTSRVLAVPSPLHATIEKLASPVDPGADLVLTAAELEKRRLQLLTEAKEVSRMKLDMEMRMREYNKAGGFKPVTPRVAVAAKDKGKNLSRDFAKVAESSTRDTSVSGRYTSTLEPKYSTPAKNMRAARAAAEELPHLTGDALLKQQARVTELLAVANRQTKKLAKKFPTAGASSQVIHSAKGKSVATVSSPHSRHTLEPSLSSGRRNRQLQIYDPAIANAGDADAESHSAGGRSAARANVGRANVGRRNAGRGAESEQRGDS